MEHEEHERRRGAAQQVFVEANSLMTSCSIAEVNFIKAP